MIYPHYRCDVTHIHFRFHSHNFGSVIMFHLVFRDGAVKFRVIHFCLFCAITNLTYVVNIQDIVEMTSCTGVISSSKGVLVNINYPGDYFNMINCNTTIRVPGAIMIEVIFDYFHTESESDYNLLNAMCTTDYLEIFDSNESYRICGHWSGKEHLLYFRFNSPQIQLTFHLNKDDVRSGFKMRWYSTPGRTHAYVREVCVNPLLETEHACFEVVTEPEVWEVGHNICRERGAALAQVEDEAVHRKLEQSLQERNLSYTSFWIGANDQLFEGDYMWTDRTTVGFKNWFPGWVHLADNGTRSTSQPSDDGFSNEDCVEIRRHFAYPGKGIGLTRSYFWNDRNCQVKNPFICQHVKTLEKRPKRSAPFDCSGVFNLSAESPSIVLTSPGHPGEYPRLLSCHVIIRAPPGWQIQFDFKHMHIEDAITNCEFDNLTLANYPATRPQHHVTRCGDWNRELKLLQWTSDVNVAIVTFQTDNSKQFSGFKVNASLIRKSETMCKFSDEGDWVYGPRGCWQIHNEIQNYSGAQTGCQAIGGSVSDVTTNLHFVGSLLEDHVISFTCLDAWIQNAASLTDGNSDDNSSGNICSGIRICKQNTTGLLGAEYESVVIQVPCFNQLTYICTRPEKHTDYQTFVYNYTTSSGTLSSSCNYSNNEDTTHVIRAEYGKRILLEITRFDIEYQETCLYDSLEISGTYQDNRYCGSSTNITLLSRNTTIVLHFKSDDSITGCGYDVTWKWINVNQTFDVENTVSGSGSIKSVNFPKSYPGALDGCYDISAPENQRVLLELHVLKLPGYGCDVSFLEIRGILKDSNASLCGGRNTSDIGHFRSIFISASNEMTICLKTFSLEHDEGFNASFSLVSASTATLKRTLVIEPAQTAHVTSIMYPFGFPWDFYQETELRTAIGHRLTFERFDVTFSELTNCSNDSLNVFDLSLSAEPEKAMYTSPCPLNCTTSAIDVPGSFLNVAKITLQSGFHDSRVSSIQFQAVVTSVPDPDLLEKTVSSEGSFIGCEVDTCRNDGHCAAAGSDRSTCTCTPQYRGLFCQKSMCDLRPCRHGNCSLSDMGFTCTCRPNYWGARCDMDDVMCRWKMCSSRGRCVSVNGTRTACLCDPTWTGKRCTDTIPVIPENLTIGQKLLKEPIWIGMIVILNLVLFFCLSYIVRRKCGRRLSNMLPKRKKTTVSTVKEDSRTETPASSSNYLDIPRIQSRSATPRLQIGRPRLASQSPPNSTPTTPCVDDCNKDAAMKLFESYKANIIGLSPNLSSDDLENKVLKSNVTDFRTTGIPPGRVSFSGCRVKEESDCSPPGILRSYTINTGAQDSKSRLGRFKRISRGNTYAGVHSKRSVSDAELGGFGDDGNGHVNFAASVHCFPEIKILNENNMEQEKGSDSDSSIGVSTNPRSQANKGPPFRDKALELRRSSECIDSGYPSTTVSSSNTNPAIQLENTERSWPVPMSAVERRKLYSSKSKSSSFYNITTSSQFEKETSRPYFSLPEKRTSRERSIGRGASTTELERCRFCYKNKLCSCHKSRHGRGTMSCDSDLDYMPRRKEFVDTASYSKGLERHRKHRGHPNCSCDFHRCNSNRSYTQSEPNRHQCKHLYPVPSVSRYVNFGDLRHAYTYDRSLEKASSSESEAYHRPRRQIRFKRKMYRNNRMKSSVRTKHDYADLDQQRRIERDFGDEEPYKAALLRSFLSDTYQANVTGDIGKTKVVTNIDRIHVDKSSTEFRSLSDDLLQTGAVPMHSPNSIEISYDNDCGSSVQGSVNDLDIAGLDRDSDTVQHTDGTDNSVFEADIKSNSNSTGHSPGLRSQKNVLSSKVSLKDSAYQTKQSSVDKYAPTLQKDPTTTLQNPKVRKKSDSSTRTDDKVKRHLHQAALKLAMFKRLQAKEQYSKDSAIHTFSEDDLSVDEIDTRHRPLIKRTSGSLLAFQMKELNLSRVTEELSRETNTPTNEPQTEQFDKTVTGIRTPSDIQMSELNKTKRSVDEINKVKRSVTSKVGELAMEETLV